MRFLVCFRQDFRREVVQAYPHSYVRCLRAAGHEVDCIGEGHEIESIAFESEKPDRGYTVKASYLKKPNNGDALIQVSKDGSVIREFLFPAYKIWNIAAHFSDIVDGEIEKSASGYEMAASTGLHTPSISLEDES